MSQTIIYKKLVYNIYTNEIGQPVYKNGMLLVDLGKRNIYKVYLEKYWQIIGEI